MPTDNAAWLCCQLGAREHYAVPRALHRRGDLNALITDAWARPGRLWPLLPGATGRRLRQRYSADLASAEVRDFTASLVAHEARWRVSGLRGWPLVVARNRWFQAKAAAVITSMPAPAAIFAHSYAALEIFRAAKARGSSTVLGQIDPGVAHVEVVRQVADRWPEFGPPPAEPPPEYFAGWREECRLADRIIVNSEWSRDSLQRAGIEVEKIRIVPLPYHAEGTATVERRYPAAFSPDRPLRVLFAGSVAAFKGVPSLLESLDQLGDAPIELRLVGPLAATIPQRFLGDRRVKVIGAVSRSDIMDHYRDADVLVFPSHSDGFGMAQVEAQAWRLPIIASRACGRVVTDGIDGLLLPEVSSAAIASALRQVMQPGVLTRLSQPAAGRGTSLDAFGDALSEMRPRG